MEDKKIKEKINIGFAFCGSFCTFKEAIARLEALCKRDNVNVYPIKSANAANTDTRFGKAEDFKKQIEKITGKKIIETIQAAEPIGPEKLLDILIIAPCTGNTLGKISNGITDTSVVMAAKAHIRNRRPVLIAISTNDGLGASAHNIGKLLNTKHIYFVPYGQDDAVNKPMSLKADMGRLWEAVEFALKDEQLQPVLI